MRTVMFLGFETDILEKEKARPVQVAAELVGFAEPGEEGSFPKVSFSSLLDPQGEILPEAMAVHRIEQEEVTGKPVLSDCVEFREMLGYADYICAHNGRAFDFLILQREVPKEAARFINSGVWIDTLVLARKAWPEFPEHKLAGLSYRLGLVSKAERKTFNFHDAQADTILCRKLFEAVMERTGLIDVDSVWEYSRTPNPAEIFPFGKYTGVSISDLLREDARYLEWCLKQPWLVTEWPEVFLGIIKETMPDRLSESSDQVAEVMKKLL